MEPPTHRYRRRILAGDSAALALIVALPLAVAFAGVRGPLPLILKLGPNAGAYLQGFDPLYEITPADQSATRWSSYDSTVALPLVVQGGPIELAYRFARVLPETAVVETSLAGHLVDRFSCRGGAFEVRRVKLTLPQSTPVTVSFHVDSHDRRNLGLKMDWVRLDLGAGGRVFPAGAARFRPVLLVVAVWALLRFAGFANRGALLLTLPLSVGVAAWALLDPLGLAHVAAKIVVPAAFLSAAVAVILRHRVGGRFVVAIFVAGYLLKGAAVFYPTTFYPDVMNHRRYVFALMDGEGSLAERGVAAQVKVKTAYPRFVAGRAYAFPYSPVFFVPFTWLAREPELIEDAMRHVALAAAAAEVPLVFWIAGLVFGPGSGVAAALLASILPPLHSRLLLAMWPTIVGHLLDTVAIAAALRLSASPGSLGRLLGLGASTLAAFLAYISSLFNLTGVLGFLALIERQLAVRLVALLAAAGSVTVLWLYGPFTVTFFREILPAMGHGGGSSSGEGLGAALARVPLFYGYGFPALAAAGFVLAWRRADHGARRVLSAYGLTFVLLVLLRGLGGGLFKDLKEITFVGPLVAVTAGASLEVLWRASPRGRVVAVLVALGLIAFGLGKYCGYLADYSSPVTHI